MPKSPPPYAPEFKEEAVRLFRTSGRSIGSLAADLGVAHETLRTWIKRHEIDGGNAPGVTSAERRSGTPADNAVAESFFATLQTELLDRRPGRPERASERRSSSTSRSSTTANAATQASPTSAPTTTRGGTRASKLKTQPPRALDCPPIRGHSRGWHVARSRSKPLETQFRKFHSSRCAIKPCGRPALILRRHLRHGSPMTRHITGLAGSRWSCA